MTKKAAPKVLTGIGNVVKYNIVRTFPNKYGTHEKVIALDIDLKAESTKKMLADLEAIVGEKGLKLMRGNQNTNVLQEMGDDILRVKAKTQFDVAIADKANNLIESPDALIFAGDTMKAVVQFTPEVKKNNSGQTFARNYLQAVQIIEHDTSGRVEKESKGDSGGLVDLAFEAIEETKADLASLKG